MLKLKLQYFGHLMRRADSLEKTLMGQDWGAKTGTGECGNLVLPAPGLVALFASLAVVGTPLSALEGLNGAKVGSMVGGGVVGPGCLLLETRSPSRPGEVQP